jgi:hypothetical protein
MLDSLFCGVRRHSITVCSVSVLRGTEQGRLRDKGRSWLVVCVTGIENVLIRDGEIEITKIKKKQ